MASTDDRSILQVRGPEPARVVRHGPGPQHLHDLYPGPPGAPWVVLVHGGFWRPRWDRTHLRPLAGALVEAGYAVALVEYARPGMPGGGWPGTGDDVAAAVAAVRAGAGDAPVLLVGHSAGGQLALCALHRPEAAGVAGAVSLAGCLDLALVDELDLDGGAARALLGASPQQRPELWRQADPARLGPALAPVVVVHGDADELVPAQVSRSWWQAAAVPGRDRRVSLPGVGHFGLVDPRTPAFPVLTGALAGLAGTG
jgi:acetyl esterase/lipase